MQGHAAVLVNAAELEELDLSANMLENSLPPDYVYLRHLKILVLSANQLNGYAQKMMYALLRRCLGCRSMSAVIGLGLLQ